MHPVFHTPRCERSMVRVLIILNSEQVANELLEDRSVVYSDRPHIATRDLCALFMFN